MIKSIHSSGNQKRKLYYKEEVENTYSLFMKEIPSEIELANVFVMLDGTFCPCCDKSYALLDDTHVVEDVEMFIYYIGDFPRPNALLYTTCRVCADLLNSQEEKDFEAYEALQIRIKDRIFSLYLGEMKTEEERTKEKKLEYQNKIETHMRKRVRIYKENGYAIDTCLMDYFSESCFLCGEAFQITNNRVKNADGIMVHVDTFRKIAFPYPQCKSCKEKVSKYMAGFAWLGKEVIKMTEDATAKSIDILYSTPPRLKL